MQLHEGHYVGTGVVVFVLYLFGGFGGTFDTRARGPYAGVRGPLPSEPRAGGPQPHIPKIVHQTYKSRTLPANYAQWKRACEATNPEWEFKLWTDEDNLKLIQDHYPELLELYLGYDVTIKRIDMVRYTYLHHYGGVYLDMDMVCLKPFDTETDFNTSSSFWVARNKPSTPSEPYPPTGVAGGWSNQFMASPIGHPLLLSIFQALPAHAKEHVLYATGPGFLTNQLQQYDRTLWRDFAMEKVYGQTYDAPNMCTSREDCMKRFPNAMTVSLFTHSWKPGGELTVREWAGRRRR